FFLLKIPSVSPLFFRITAAAEPGNSILKERKRWITPETAPGADSKTVSISPVIRNMTHRYMIIRQKNAGK
ncbi:hypothetical protein K6U71_14210, partial [Vibrio alginolyticus]|nr:hypothetical protein [Vibrio alginolyticus]